MHDTLPVDVLERCTFKSDVNRYIFTVQHLAPSLYILNDDGSPRCHTEHVCMHAESAAWGKSHT